MTGRRMGRPVTGLNITALLVVAVLLAAWPKCAEAHKLNVFAYRDGGNVAGEAYFNDGSPARNSVVEMRGADGNTLLASGTTDVEGRFSLPVDPGGEKTLIVSVDGGMGHLGSMKVVLSPGKENPAGDGGEESRNGPGSIPASAPIASEDIARAVAEAVRKETAPLREELMLIQKELSRPKTSDIFGGLGYIVGLVGIILWAGGRKQK